MKILSELLAKDRGYLSNSKSVSLAHLDFENSDQTDRGLLIERLGSNTNLQYLDLSGCCLFRYGQETLNELFGCIQFLGGLQVINLTNNFPASKESCWVFRYILPFLKDSILNIQFDSNILFSYESDTISLLEDLFKNCPMLQVISMSCNNLGSLSETDIMCLGNILRHSSLRVLNLSMNRLEQLSNAAFGHLFTSLASISTLTELNLSVNDFSGRSPSVIHHFLECSFVEELFLNSCGLGFMRMELKDLKSLIILVCERNKIRKFGINTNHLGVLVLEDENDLIEDSPLMNSTDFLEMHIKRWTQLERLNISNNDLSNYEDILQVVAKMLLSHQNFNRYPKIHSNSNSILKDFANTGYEDELKKLITCQQVDGMSTVSGKSFIPSGGDLPSRTLASHPEKDLQSKPNFK